jgi:hypothetical protein
VTWATSMMVVESAPRRWAGRLEVVVTGDHPGLLERRWSTSVGS